MAYIAFDLGVDFQAVEDWRNKPTHEVMKESLAAQLERINKAGAKILHIYEGFAICEVPEDKPIKDRGDSIPSLEDLPKPTHSRWHDTRLAVPDSHIGVDVLIDEDLRRRRLTNKFTGEPIVKMNGKEYRLVFGGGSIWWAASPDCWIYCFEDSGELEHVKIPRLRFAYWRYSDPDYMMEEEI